MDGKYIAKGRVVLRAPQKTETGIKMGFRVCELCHEMDNSAAQEIADALNLHMAQHPENH